MLGRGQQGAGFGHGDFLELREQLDLADLVVACFGEVDAFARFLRRLIGRFHGPLRHVDLRSIGPGRSQLCGRHLAVCLRAVAGLGRFLGLAERHGFLFLEVGEPRVLLLRQEQIRRRGFQPGLGLFDPMIDLVRGELQT